MKDSVSEFTRFREPTPEKLPPLTSEQAISMWWRQYVVNKTRQLFGEDAFPESKDLNLREKDSSELQKILDILELFQEYQLEVRSNFGRKKRKEHNSQERSHSFNKVEKFIWESGEFYGLLLRSSLLPSEELDEMIDTFLHDMGNVINIAAGFGEILQEEWRRYGQINPGKSLQDFLADPGFSYLEEYLKIIENKLGEIFLVGTSFDLENGEFLNIPVEVRNFMNYLTSQKTDDSEENTQKLIVHIQSPENIATYYDKKWMTPLNISALIRVISNIFSNTEKAYKQKALKLERQRPSQIFRNIERMLIGLSLEQLGYRGYDQPEEIKQILNINIQIDQENGYIVLTLDDVAGGFPDDTGKSTVVNGTELREHLLGKGKTQWEGSPGTGIGLDGLKGSLPKLGFNGKQCSLECFNRIENGKRVGARIVIRAPLFERQGAPDF